MNQKMDRYGLAVMAYLVEHYDLREILVALATVATKRAQETGDHRLRALAVAIDRLHDESAIRAPADHLEEKGEPSYMRGSL
jgi:hypothetical protein